MAVLSGFVTTDEFKELKKRIDITILEKRENIIDKEWEHHIYVKLDCNWGIMEFLSNFKDSEEKPKEKEPDEYEVTFSFDDRIYTVLAGNDKEAEDQAWLELADDIKHQLIRDFVNDIFIEKVETDEDSVKNLAEGCECGGTARFAYFDDDNNDYRIPIVKCDRCEDEFEAEVSHWIKRKNESKKKDY